MTCLIELWEKVSCFIQEGILQWKRRYRYCASLNKHSSPSKSSWKLWSPKGGARLRLFTLSEILTLEETKKRKARHSGDPPPPPPPRIPLCHLLSPPPTSGRRRVMSLGRAEMPTFSTLNLDGSSSPPPAPPPPSPPSPFICYDDCEDDDHCSDCGKCAVLCHEHHGCDCCGEEGLDITFHCAVCCCGRSLEGQYCKLKDLLSPEAFQTASHPYLWHRSFCSHSQ